VDANRSLAAARTADTRRRAGECAAAQSSALCSLSHSSVLKKYSKILIDLNEENILCLKV